MNMRKNNLFTITLMAFLLGGFVACKPSSQNTKVGSLKSDLAPRKTDATPKGETVVEAEKLKEGSRRGGTDTDQKLKSGLNMKKVISGGNYLVESAYCLQDGLCFELGDVKLVPKERGEEIDTFAEGDLLEGQVFLINQDGSEGAMDALFSSKILSRESLGEREVELLSFGSIGVDFEARLICNESCRKPVLAMDLFTRVDGELPVARIYYELDLRKEGISVLEVRAEEGKEMRSLTELKDAVNIFVIESESQGEDTSKSLSETMSENLGAMEETLL